MAQNPTPNPFQNLRPMKLLPDPAASRGVLGTVIAGKNHVVNFFKNLTAQQLAAIGGVLVTLGLGTVAVVLYQRGAFPLLFAKDGSEATSGTSLRKPSSSCLRSASSKSRSRVGFAESTTDSASSHVTIDRSEAPPSSTGVKISENVLVLKQCPRGRKTPCIAPFPLKLETFLRVHNIAYEVDFSGHEPKLYGSPWIRFNTEDITDSQTVIRFLIDKYDIKVERELTSEQNSVAVAYTHLLENHLYWGIALWRWVYDGARSLKDIQLLPPKTQELIPDVCRTVEQAAWFHGIGKMSPEEVKKAVIDDLQALSDFLGTKRYFLNTNVPTELDCTAFGMLAQFLWNMSGPFHDALIDKFQNLRDFCWRIRQNFWFDWQDCLNNTEFFTNDAYPVADAIKYPYDE